MSTNEQPPNGTGSSHRTAIKIASKDPSRRNSAGGADPGPGDPMAEPSSMPTPVDVPEPPTSSQLMVQSTGRASKVGGVSVQQGLGSPALAGAPSTAPSSTAAGTGAGAGSGNALPLADDGMGPGPSAGGTVSPGGAVGPNASTQFGPGAGAESPPGSPLSGATSPKSASPAGSGAEVSATSPEPGTGGPSTLRKSRATSAPGASSPVAPSTRSRHSSHQTRQRTAVSGSSAATAGPSTGSKDGAKKTKHFRYHKRVTVHTKGRTNPSDVMAQVNKKDHRVGITPSTIEDMDPHELIKRAGIKDGAKTNWRVRVRQTKRTTKNGKTITQTKVAYRDSKGNKRIRTSSTPYCKRCGKKLEQCKCSNVPGSE